MSGVLPAAPEPAAPDISHLATPAPALPPTEAEFAAAMAALGPFEHRPGIAVGVSGGPDSMALALLLQSWLRPRDGQLLALVVDHRLRPDSGTEAMTVRERLAALGIEARILTRQGPLPTSAIQARARAARYDLLEQATAAAGFLHLAIAHHARDQVETLALRRAAGSGERGLAGMAACRELDHVRLIRPLLATAPDGLKALLTARAVPWIDDPANRDPRFWRARHRAGTADVAAEPPTAARRDTLDRTIAAWLAAHAGPHPLGFVEVDGAALVATPDDLLPQLLASLLVSTSGAVWPPGRTECERLAAWLRVGAGRRRALGGALVERGAGGRVSFVREPRAVAGPAVVPPSGLLWDGRFRIAPHSFAGEVTVAAAGPAWREALAARPPAIPAIVLETLPLVRVEGRGVGLGPWPLGAAGAGPVCRYRPRQPAGGVPFGQTLSASVVSPPESLMYGNA